MEGWVGTYTDIDEQKLLTEQLQQMSKQLAAANLELQATILDLKEVNERLSRTNEDLDNFVYTASHDLRSPIQNMEGLLTLLNQELADKLQTSSKILMDHLFTSLQKLKRTITDLAQIVKVSKDTGQQSEPIFLGQLFEEVKEDIAPLLVASGGELVAQWGIETIRYPRKVLRSVLYNLLSNALKYRHPKRPVRVWIRSEKLEGQVRISVQDNGLGLTSEQRSKLFQLFGRMHPGVEGSGIGLYMIKRMVENYGGSIFVESIAEEGSLFQVILPT